MTRYECEGGESVDSEPKGRCNCCSPKTKWHCGRANKAMIAVNFLLFIIFIAMGAAGLGKLQGLNEAGYMAMTDASSGIKGLFAIVVAIFFLVNIIFGCMTVCCYSYCCCCLGLWVPINFVLFILCAALATIIARFKGTVSDLACDAAEPIIREYWDDFIDGKMCSEYCPCDSDAFTTGGYSTFDRSPALVTAPVPTPYSAELQAILDAIGISEPITVTTYEECYSGMIASNTEFVNSLEASEQQIFTEFLGEVFEFLNDVEDQYNCGGFCYTPLFSITTSIAEGPPTTECLGKIMDATFSAAGAISAVGAIFMILTFLISLSLCGGMPKDDPDNEMGADKA